ncbi:hypothetical protein IFM89_005318 [Coptis chinensis]|uniref:AB hydrolase-1 domain-containing protein n=1 Tax=Coptis chinensis TaxID=261450 RepID=A0A835HCP9_9MAGN|nr:hypothetical protein IFM89_005318 [Coptis chinensis]
MSSTVSTSSRVQSQSSAPFTQSEPDFNESDLLSVSWNQDYGCFAAGTTRGFRIYNCDPFKETFRRDLKTGLGFGIVEMLFRCNILALVGADLNPQSEVRAVKLRRDRIVVILEHKIYVYNFMDLRLLHQIETLSNPRGLCCLSHHSNTFVLASPGLHRGQIRIEHFGLKITKFINAHDSQIACFTLTMDGLLLATASTKGTLIRIFNTMDGTRLQEVRRGVDNAEIYSLALSPNVQWLAVSSDKGTVHIFSLRVRVVGEDPSNHSATAQRSALVHQSSSTSLDALISPTTGANPGSSLSFMKGLLPKYFSSEWSFAQFHLPENVRFVAAFGSHNTVLMIGMDGRCSFDTLNGGEMSQQEYYEWRAQSPLQYKGMMIMTSSAAASGFHLQRFAPSPKTSVTGQVYRPPPPAAAASSGSVSPSPYPGDTLSPYPGVLVKQLVGVEKKQKRRSIAGIDQDELVDPSDLADSDSCFLDFKGVSIHHKIYEHQQDPTSIHHSATPMILNQTTKLRFPIILLHGFGASLFSWNQAIKPLARATGSKVVAFDRPAFGLTSRSRAASKLAHHSSTAAASVKDKNSLNPYSMAFSVLATLTFIDLLAADKAILIGHSSGSLVAVNTYFEAPERVAALILIAPAILVPRKRNQTKREKRSEGSLSTSKVKQNPFAMARNILSKFSAYIAWPIVRMLKGMMNTISSLFRRLLIAFLHSKVAVMLLRMVIDKFGVAAIRNAWYDASQITDHVLHGYTKPLRTKDWDWVLLEYTVAMLTDTASEPPLPERLKEISCPVLIITGDNDRLVPSWNAERLSRAIPGSCLEVIKNCGHLPHEEKVEEFISVAQKFLERVFGAAEEQLLQAAS